MVDRLHQRISARAQARITKALINRRETCPNMPGYCVDRCAAAAPPLLRTTQCGGQARQLP